jgi:uncharacterized RDD family membrane protein YckC
MKIADKGTRFGNYILDTLGFFVILMLHAFILDKLFHIIPEDGSALLGIYYFILYFGYHFLFEYFFGRTPGKFITNTKVTDFNGQKPTTKELLKRNVCRLIPFDNLSFLFGATGWHDSISETQVVYNSKRN